VKILVIDDDEHVRRMVTKALQRGGCEAEAACDGRGGMGLVRRDRPRIVTDIVMQGQEDIATLLELRRDYPDTKIIAISGNGAIGGAGRLKMAQQLGAHDAIA
jgi:DNA-binding NtrC family response regulator